MNSGATLTRPRIGHLLVVFGLFLSLFTLTFQATNPGKTRAFGTSEVAELSNVYRHNADLQPLVLSQTLTESAQAKADDMVAKGYFAHNSPDGTTPWMFFSKVNYAYDTAGENLALTNQSASAVVDGWYNSPGHRANMLSSLFTEVGYGIAFVPSFTYNGTVYSDVYLVAAHYAKPTMPVSGAAGFRVVSKLPPGTPTTQTSGNGITTVANTHTQTFSKIPYYGLGIGIVLIIVGVATEVRRLLKHQPLLPHFR